jgi:hypothetical protein
MPAVDLIDSQVHWHNDGTHYCQVCLYCSLCRSDKADTIQVETTLYKIHADVLSRGSHTFRDMFGSRHPDQVELDGVNRNQPIMLVQMTAKIFDIFLSILYGG